jgi:cytochrome c biogenesis protein CcmG/thiol:disulfide interchange protein DsbE
VAMKRPGVIVIAVLGVLLGGLLVYGLVQRQDKRNLDAAVANGRRPPAPDQTLPRLGGGGTASIASYRGKVVVLNFWASWCPPCRQEAPLLARFQRTLLPRGTVLGVTYKDEPSASLGFMRRYGLTYPSLYDGKLQLAPKYGTTALPETFVIDRRGRIVALSRGEVTQRFLTHAVAEAERS